MSRLRIVRAQETDVPLILELIQALAVYERLAHEVVADEDRVRETLFGAEPAAEVVLAYWERESAGFAIFFQTYSTFLARRGFYLEDLYVRPHLRGKGIGLGLLKYLAGLSIQRGCGRLEWGVLDWNEPAIQFYKKLGAVPMDQWTKYRLSGTALEQLARAM
jgi:GNAT superfamily N-acetyltransferase